MGCNPSAVSRSVIPNRCEQGEAADRETVRDRGRAEGRPPQLEHACDSMLS